MSGLEIAFGIVLLAFAVGIIAIVLLQEGQQKNESVITENTSDTFLSKNKSRSIDAFLARWTRFIAVGFFIFVIVINIIMFFAPSKASAQNGNTASSTASQTTSSQAVSGTASAPAGSTASTASAPETSSTASSTPASSAQSAAASSTGSAAESNASTGSTASSTPAAGSSTPASSSSVPVGSAATSNS